MCYTFGYYCCCCYCFSDCNRSDPGCYDFCCLKEVFCTLCFKKYSEPIAHPCSLTCYHFNSAKIEITLLPCISIMN